MKDHSIRKMLAQSYKMSTGKYINEDDALINMMLHGNNPKMQTVRRGSSKST